ncbi:MAG: S41 family peptidase [Fastidiosipilaceae bacterium]
MNHNEDINLSRRHDQNVTPPDSARGDGYSKGPVDSTPNVTSTANIYSQQPQRPIQNAPRQSGARQPQEAWRPPGGQPQQGFHPQPSMRYQQARQGVQGSSDHISPVKVKSSHSGIKIWPIVTASLVTMIISVLITLALSGKLGAPAPWIGSTVEDISVTTSDTSPEAQAAVDKLNETIRYLSQNYYRELSPAELLTAMAEGMPTKMDSIHTYSMTAEEYQTMLDSQDGSYSGIGATIQERRVGGGVEVIEIVTGSPADLSNLKVGDIFVAIDGVPLDTADTTTEVAARVRGPVGTKVTVRVYRPSLNQELDIELTRANVHPEYIRTRMLNDELGYLQVTSFTNDLYQDFKAGVDSLVKMGAKNIVFDLRNNPGGSAQTVHDMLDYLLPETDLVVEKGRRNGSSYEEVWTSDANMGVPEDMKYVILVNENSASASELFSGTLRDLGKAYLIGETTYGKGSGTVTFSLRDGSAINVTIFRYYLPSGYSVEDVGLDPDQEVKLSDEALLHNIRTLLVKDDAPLRAAIEYFGFEPDTVSENPQGEPFDK